MNTDEIYMHRCLELAALGSGFVAPNPMVGALLVYDHQVIGEGYHRKFGEAHAEVNCLASVREEDKQWIPDATLYVSLEPCAHYGKTPPCTELILKHRIRKVVIGCSDPFAQVNGKGIQQLTDAGVEVQWGILEDACRQLNKRFFTFHTEHRPYVLLKWAQTLDGFIAGVGPGRLLISNEYTNRLVHKWRSENMSILVGTNTVFADNPSLTTRLWRGKNPVRLVADSHLRLPATHHIFDHAAPTVIFNLLEHTLPDQIKAHQLQPGTYKYQITEDVSTVHQVLHALYQLQVQSVIIEGGARLLQSFIDEGVWDEAIVITNEQLIIGEGLPAPQLMKHRLISSEQIFTDIIRYYQPQ